MSKVDFNGVYFVKKSFDNVFVEWRLKAKRFVVFPLKKL